MRPQTIVRADVLPLACRAGSRSNDTVSIVRRGEGDAPVGGPAAARRDEQARHDSCASRIFHPSHSPTSRIADDRDGGRPASAGRNNGAFVRVRGAREHNLTDVTFEIQRDALVVFTGVSGSGKSSLVGEALVELVSEALGRARSADDESEELDGGRPVTLSGEIAGGMEAISRLVRVDQRPRGRTPRSNLATYAGLFDHVRRRFAATKGARARRYDAGRFSFNVARGRARRTLYILDEPMTGLHPSDVERLVAQLDGLVEAGNSVVVVEHGMRVVAASDCVINIGPRAGEEGGWVVVSGTLDAVARNTESRTSPDAPLTATSLTLASPPASRRDPGPASRRRE